MEQVKSKHNQKLVVRRAIERERKFQDKKWGSIEKNPHPIGRWIEIMQDELQEAIEAYSENSTEDALSEIVQVVAVGHACLEQHGIVSFRE